MSILCSAFTTFLQK